MSRADFVLDPRVTLVGRDGFRRRVRAPHDWCPTINVPVPPKPGQRDFTRRVFRQVIWNPLIYLEVPSVSS